MNTFIKRLQSTSSIQIPDKGHTVFQYVADALTKLAGRSIPVQSGSGHDGSLQLRLEQVEPAPSSYNRHRLFVQIDEAGKGVLSASHPAHLYAWVHWLATHLSEQDEASLEQGIEKTTGFSWHRPIYDTALTQIARTARRFDPERYIEAIARHGFTHLEVNALAFPTPFEPGAPHEFYRQFYTYCPGLNHFVESTLTRGIYGASYLQANLNLLKKYAAIGRAYGLKPGILCFEPRSLPESFFQTYPTLRGARIDHPFRSHLPRYTLAQDHPVARDHYRQLIQQLLEEVPDLAYLSVWTNDSGSGFEHTSSLYVGRNGGPYMIREWNNHEAIARVAGQSAAGWLNHMQASAAAINPTFEVMLRIEPFKVEHDILVEHMGEGVSIEAPSLLVKGYDLPYQHPAYPEQAGIAGTIFHDQIDASEQDALKHYRQRGMEPKISYASGSTYNMEPLLGIPFPRLLYNRLQSLRSIDVRCINAFGGLHHAEETPYWPNPEVIRALQMDPEMPLESILLQSARSWVGTALAPELVRCWLELDEVVRYTPFIPLYSVFGFVWLRTWVRPLIPDLEAIPEAERAYYERFMVSTPNNPSINDLGRDVLFQLITKESGRQKADQIDTEALPRLEKTLAGLSALSNSQNKQATDVFDDLLLRARALKCWITTQRNTCAWVHGVYTYLESDSAAQKAEAASYLQHMIDLDLENTRQLIALWDTAQRDFMLVSDVGETSFIYGENFRQLLDRKIQLTEKYRKVEPRIDRDIIWRIPGH